MDMKRIVIDFFLEWSKVYFIYLKLHLPVSFLSLAAVSLISL